MKIKIRLLLLYITLKIIEGRSKCLQSSLAAKKLYSHMFMGNKGFRGTDLHVLTPKNNSQMFTLTVSHLGFYTHFQIERIV